MDDRMPPLANAQPVPAADVTVPPADGGSVVHQAYPLKQPEEEASEFIVQVRASTLRRTRRRLGSLVVVKFPWPEVLLGLATLCTGGALGAIASNVEWNCWKAKIFYLILPIIAVGAGVAYVMLRHLVPQAASSVAQDVLEDLPDPDRTK